MSRAKLLKYGQLGLAVFWALMIPISYKTGLSKLIEFLNFISLYALVAAHLAGWQAARSEVKVDKAAEVSGQEVNVENAARVEEKP